MTLILRVLQSTPTPPKPSLASRLRGFFLKLLKAFHHG